MSYYIITARETQENTSRENTSSDFAGDAPAGRLFGRYFIINREVLL